MPNTTNEQTVDTLNIANTKTIAETRAAANAMMAESVAASMALATQNAVATQQIANQNMINAQQDARVFQQAVNTMAVNKLVNVDPAEAVALQKTLTGDDIAQKVIAAFTALGGGQITTKNAQTTPPVTAQTPPVE